MIIAFLNCIVAYFASAKNTNSIKYQLFAKNQTETTFITILKYGALERTGTPQT